uniref:T9SS type A sorting domain-containing protein n=1 Tax=Aquimarina pacifica TaxID=1296415 RepID=UPI000470EF68
ITGPEVTGSGCAKLSLSNNEIGIKCYPNPLLSSDMLTIDLPKTSTANVQLINLSGQVIESTIINNGSGTMTFQHPASGVYILKVVTDTKSYFEKISIQN